MNAISALACGLGIVLLGSASPKAHQRPADLVAPILDTVAQAVGKPDVVEVDRIFRKAEYMLYRLSRNTSPEADEALAGLLWYYLGEAPGEDLLHQITVRGKRMLPYLLKYRDHPLLIPGRKYPTSMLVPAKIGREDYDTAIDYIKKGKIWGED